MTLLLIDMEPRITITKTYNDNALFEDLKTLCIRAGVKGAWAAMFRLLRLSASGLGRFGAQGGYRVWMLGSINLRIYGLLQVSSLLSVSLACRV